LLIIQNDHAFAGVAARSPDEIVLVSADRGRQSVFWAEEIDGSGLSVVLAEDGARDPCDERRLVHIAPGQVVSAGQIIEDVDEVAVAPAAQRWTAGLQREWKTIGAVAENARTFPQAPQRYTRAMAARVGALTEGLEIVDLRSISGRELDPLLLEEAAEWKQDLHWDFAKSAELVRQFTDTRALTGAALLDCGEVVGYGYSVVEDQKGLIGDLYVRQEWRTPDTVLQLFRAILDGLTGLRTLRRIESQLMLVDPLTGGELRASRGLKVYDRLLMSFDFEASAPAAKAGARRRFHLEPWGDHLQESVAVVIAMAYQDHIDSRINDQYGTIAGARRFVANIVQFPGCGFFYRPGSFVAFDPATGRLAGILLVSFVSADVGHITQLCVTPEAQRSGLGYEMLLKGLAALRAGGARRVTLTVTDANAGAVDLYRRCGFRELRQFSAFVWDAPAG
jgi:ribosomal protein S18 acetylase RimI-like enzyme